MDDHADWDQLDLTRVAADLAEQLRQTTGLPNLSDVQIAAWDYARDLAEIARARTASNHRVLGLSQEDLVFRYGAFSPIAPGQDVVLFIGSVLTGRTATTLLRVLRRMEARTLAVATVVDGRVNHGEPIATLSGPVPVVSCLKQKLVRVDALPSTVVDVDSAGNELWEPPEPGPEITSDAFLGWLTDQEDSGVYLGHIERRRAGSGAYYRRARHFSTYLNMGELIAGHAGPIEAVVSNVRKALGERYRKCGGLRVLHPATQGNIAGQLAGAVAARLTIESGLEVPVVPARRGAGGEWHLTSGLSSPFIAVIVDWGAVTTTTVRALMGLAIQSGAERIHAVVLTSQMSRRAELDLTSIALMRGRRLMPSDQTGRQSSDHSKRPEYVEVPVSAAFLARVPMGMATIPDCHLCQLAHEFRSQTNEAPTDLLRDHAARKFELYRPRARPEAATSVGRDIVGSNLRSGEATNVWKCHLLMEEAESSPAARIAVRESIAALANGDADTASLVAWLRLLAVEPYWLNRGSLSASDTRAAISRSCIEVLLGAPNAHEPGIRWQAAIVLRVASKGAFLQCFAKVLASVAEDASVAPEVCYGMLTLLARPYNQSSPVLDDAVNALSEARVQLLAQPDTGQLSRDLRLTLDAIHRRANVVHRKATQPRHDLLASWLTLQSAYVEPMKNHDKVLTSMLIVLNALSGPSAKEAAAEGRDSGYRTPTYWQGVVEAWSDCWDFVATGVFPHLPALGELLGTLELSRAHGRSLLEFGHERAEAVSRRLRMLERFPSWFSPSLRVELEVEAFQWFEAFLAAPVPHGVSSRGASPTGALLLRILEENPCDLASAWSAAITRARAAGFRIASISGEIPTGQLVFAGRSLLVDVFGQALENATRTHAVDNRPRQGVAVALALSRTADQLIVRVRNNWSRASGSNQGGLASYRDALALFGAHLTYTDLTGRGESRAGEWSFEMTLSLRLWQESA